MDFYSVGSSGSILNGDNFKLMAYDAGRMGLPMAEPYTSANFAPKKMICAEYEIQIMMTTKDPAAPNADCAPP